LIVNYFFSITDHKEGSGTVQLSPNNFIGRYSQKSNQVKDPEGNPY